MRIVPFSKTLLIILTGILVCFGGFSAYRVYARRYIGTVEPFPKLSSKDRLTIVSPHPDDETIGLGGLIYHARQENIPVSVIFMTNGDADMEGADPSGHGSTNEMTSFGKTRQEEAIRALRDLGVKDDSVFFLDLPDHGLKAILTSGNSLYTSPSTGLSSASGYDRAYEKDLPYLSSADQAALLKAIDQTHPTKLFTTMREDSHPDHWATGQFVENLRREVSSSPKVYSFLVHYPGYVDDKDGFAKPLVPPAQLKKLPWDEIRLSKDEQDHQAAAIQEYKSELNVGKHNRAIMNSGRPNELVVE